MSFDIQMYNNTLLGLESQEQMDNVTNFSNIEELEAFEEIFFKLLITGNSELAKKYVRNYLKNFYREII